MRRTGRGSERLQEEKVRKGVEEAPKPLGLALSPIFAEPIPGPAATTRLGWWLRRLMSLSAAGDAPIRLEGRLSLGPKKSLVLVSCCGKSVLLALSGDAITPVMDIPVPRRRKREPEP